MKTAIALFVGVLMIWVSAQADSVRVAQLPECAKYIANKLVIQNKPEAPPYLTGQTFSGIAHTGVSSVDELCCRTGVIKVEQFYPGILRDPILKEGISKFYIFTFSEDVDVLNAIPEFAAEPNIKVAALYSIPEACYVPNDPRVADQWYLPHIQAFDAWDIVRGDTTRHSIIGIVDSGVQWTHPDLAPNIWINATEDINHNGVFDNGDLNGIDDDNNGFVDDVVGWDFGDGDNLPVDDITPHGTAVAGCASEATDNALQGAAVGFSARLMAVKVFQGGMPTNAYQGMIYAADNGAKIINCSWAIPAFNQAEQEMINTIWLSGALVVASAGGFGDTTRVYPAAYNHVVAVASTGALDQGANFSGRGGWVDVSAPGTDIWTTYGSTGFELYSGTSFSAGMVSGLAALMHAWLPSLSGDEIELLIESSADSIANNQDLHWGAGRINAYNWLDPSYAESPNIPGQFSLKQNYPNPFNAQTTIEYYLDKECIVNIDIYDITGRIIAAFHPQDQSAGAHSIIWDSNSAASGIYFYRVKAGDSAQTKKCTLLK